MQAALQDIETLLSVQKIDLEVMQATKKRVELPQRIEVMRLRKKRAEIQEKLDQVFELHKRAQSEMTLVEDEERSLAEKQARAQELIDAAGSDYRKVESHSREMASVAKRREEIAEKMQQVTAQLDKINGIRTQLENAIAASESEETRLRAAFEGEDQELAERIRMLGERRQELMAQIDPSLVSLYEKTASKLGGVAIGVLNEDTCGVCRSHIDGGRLIEVRASAPLATCPNCKRLLAVLPQEEVQE